MTPLAPWHFLLLASVANVGKSVGLTTHIATQPAFQRSFARRENLADVAAKAQVGGGGRIESVLFFFFVSGSY
jgi:hypothetical protein